MLASEASQNGRPARPQGATRTRRTLWVRRSESRDRERSWRPFSEADLVAEVAHAREYHRHPVFIYGLGHLGVTNRPAGLNHTGDTGFCRGIDAVLHALPLLLHLRRRSLPWAQAGIQTILHVGLRFGQAGRVVGGVPAAVGLGGEVTEVNEALRADPSLANSDPLGAGWFFKVKLSDPAQVDALLDATAYEAFSKNA